MDGFFSRVICLRPRRKKLWIGLGTGIQSVRFSQAGFEVTGLPWAQICRRLPRKEQLSAKQRLILLKAICWICPKREIHLSRYSTQSVKHAGWEVRGRTSLRRCIMPSMKMEYLSLMCIRPTRHEVFPGYSYHEMEDFAMLDTYEDEASPIKCAWVDFLFVFKEVDLVPLGRHERGTREERTMRLWPMIFYWNKLLQAFQILCGLWDKWADRNQHLLVFCRTEVGEHHDHHSIIAEFNFS